MHEDSRARGRRRRESQRFGIVCRGLRKLARLVLDHGERAECGHASARVHLARENGQ